MRKAIVTLVVLVALFVVVAVPAAGQSFYNTFDDILAKSLKTTGDVTVGDDLSVGDALAVTGAVSTGALAASSLNVTANTTTDNLIVNGYIASTDMLYLIPGDEFTVTGNGTITATTAVVELTAAGTVAASLAACGDGQVTMFINTANQTITISDTGTTRLAGDAVLGQWDTLTVIGQGVSCNEISRSNN